MASPNLEVLLQKIHHMIDVQEKIAAKTGENFNVFKILGMEALEVRTHSSFLRELLDPKGEHGMGSVFLKLFLSYLSDKNEQAAGFDSPSATVIAEKPIGPINKTNTRGGRIDLFLEDKNHRRIFIENKIYAGDQPNQLLRYHGEDNQAILVYLTLHGTEPSSESTGGNDFSFKLMSYKKEIFQWLENCRKEAVTHPVVREALTQYIELIRHLTNQTTKEYMMEDIEKLLIENPEYSVAINAAQNTLDSIRKKTEENFWRLFDKAFSKEPVQLAANFSIRFEADEDSDGFFIGYRLFEGEANKSGSETADHYFQALKEINSEFRKNGNWLGWYNPTAFAGKTRFAGLDLKTVLNLYSNKNTELEIFIRRIVEQDQQIRTTFAAWQKQDSLKE
ncbi:MAG: PD-(D/E)XK nuclease family protein [Kiritimatiellaceae bacterium]|nr:PD-(D/E)XK nuclease family protein [Kiritimatiellaceae bacterium]